LATPDLNDMAARAAEQVSGGVAMVAERIAGGAVGAVFRVTLQGGWGERGRDDCVVKITRPHRDPEFAEELAETRVYGARASNLMPAHRLLRVIGAPLPAWLIRDQDRGWRRVVMQALPGSDLRETLGLGDAPDLEGLHARTGDLMGRLHTVTRPHQGWVDAPKVGAGWQSEFLEVFTVHRQRLRALDLVPPEQLDNLEEQVAAWAAIFHDPRAFVLSHTDGLQAMAVYDGRWTISGLVDIEDYQFTDPRMALAGHELAVEFYGQSVPEAFWDAYRAHVPVAEGFEALRPMFRAFYLTIWARVLRDDASARDRCLALLLDQG
jgi:hypothetical protein